MSACCRMETESVDISLWASQRPCRSYGSARPRAAVDPTDAERALSEGRLSVNLLQQRTKFALGSWYGTLLLPSLERLGRIIIGAF
jgi:hypothetical protein